MGQLHWLGGIGVILELWQVYRGQRLVLRLSWRLLMRILRLIILSLRNCCWLHWDRWRHCGGTLN